MKDSSSVIIQSPTSFVGSARRIWKLTRVKPELPWLKVITMPTAVILVAAAWLLCAVWLVVFGIIMVPWRLLRRGQRKRKLAELDRLRSSQVCAEDEHQQLVAFALRLEHQRNELHAIVKDLAAGNVGEGLYGMCVLCRHDMSREHDPSCPWRRAVEAMEAQ